MIENCRPASNWAETGRGIRACGRGVGAGSTGAVRPQEHTATAISSTVTRKRLVLELKVFTRSRASSSHQALWSRKDYSG